MIGSTKLLACLFFYVSSTAILSVESNIAVVDYRVRIVATTKQFIWKYYSGIVNATSEPTVYGCSYLSSSNSRIVDDGICLPKIKNGELQALPAQNTSDTSLRNIYYPRSSVVNGTYWYIYEVPSCWRNHEIYATIDGQNYTRLWKYEHVPSLKGAPTGNATFDETTKCMSVKIDALEDGNCSDYQYQILIQQVLVLKKDSCETCDNTHQWCCLLRIIPWESSFKFNGTLSNSVLNYQHCYTNNTIKMINDTFTDTGPYTAGLYRILSNKIQVNAKAMIGEISGKETRIAIIELGTPEEIVNGSGGIHGAGVTILIVLFMIIFVQGIVI